MQTERTRTTIEPRIINCNKALVNGDQTFSIMDRESAKDEIRLVEKYNRIVKEEKDTQRTPET